MKYDVVVVGAGPAGSGCARELAKKGLSVLILERSLEIGQPNFSTAGTPPETIRDFKLPKSVVFSSWNSMALNGPNEKAEFLFNKTIGYTLKFRELKQFLVKDAIMHGADTASNANVDKAVVKNGRVVGVEFDGASGRKIVYASIVVDATGAEGKLASQLGLRKKTMKRYSPAVEYYMLGLHLERDSKRVDLYIGSEYQGGYAWIFPTGRNQAKVGLGWALEDNKLKDKNLLHNLANFIGKNEQLKGGRPIELHSHYLFANGGLRKHSMNGFLAIGDAACQVNPLAGEGIRHCLWSGRSAAKVINNVLRNKGDISDYDAEWKERIGNKWKISAMIQKYLCKLDDKAIDILIREAKKIDGEDFLEVFFHYKFSLIKKYIRRAPSLVKEVLIGRMRW